MTDDELLTRLAESPVEEWTPDEVAALRAALPLSAALREAFAEFLLVEAALTAGLTKQRVSAEQILARADALQRAKLRGQMTRWAAVLLAVVGLGGSLYYYVLRRPDVDVARVERKPAVNAGAPEPIPLPDVDPAAAEAPSPVPQATATATAATPNVATPPPAANPDRPEPWTVMLAKAPRAHEDLAFDDRRASHDAESLGRWWDTVSGQQRPWSNREEVGLDMTGVFKLRCPWPSDAVLTFSPREWGDDVTRLHFWHGDRGVTIENHRRPYEHWAAYVAVRDGASSRPTSRSYAAGDDDRGRRTGTGPLEFAYHDGRLFMSRGDVLLLSAPIDGPPDDVYLECHAKLKSMALARSTGVPDEWLAAPPPVWNDFTPETTLLASLTDGAKAERLGPAGLTITADAETKESWAALPILRTGMHEVIFDIESADPFTGIYLGDATGKPKYAVGFFDDLRTGTVMPAFAEPRDGNVRFRTDRRSGAEPRVSFPLKLRLVAGPGSVKCFASVDGRSWGRIVEPHRGGDGGVQTVGVYCAPGKTKRTIRVSNISFRTLLAYDDAVAGDVPPAPASYDYAGWFLDAFATAPTDEVRYHKLLKALAGGLPEEAARLVIFELAALPCGDLPAGTEKTLLDDLDYVGRLAQVADAWDPGIAAIWTDRLLRSPVILADRQDADETDVAIHAPFSSVRKTLVEKSPDTYGNVTMLPADAIRREIARMLLDGDWDRLERACRVWHRFGGRDESNGRMYVPRLPIMLLIDWAAATAERRRDAADGGQSTGGGRSTMRPEWRHPLVEQFGKEGYNILAELETALEERAYSDACRIITSVTASQAVGLLPNAHDGDLLTSLPGAVAMAMKLHPDLRETMQREYGDLAMLRLRQATVDGDTDAVRALTTQFFGTSAAAEAQVWLGDRALAQGDAARAEGHYRTARHEGSLDAVPMVDLRLRLAAAWQGRDYGAAPTGPVRLGDATLSPAEFERVVSTLHGRAAAPSATSRTATAVHRPQRVDRLPPAATYRPKLWAAAAGDTGKPAEPPRKDLDFVAAQTAAVCTDGRMYMSNRFQTAAFDLKDAKLAWRTGLGSEQGKAFQWPGQAMAPVVTEDRIFVRRLLAVGPELACLNKADGRVRWRTPRGEIIASDPIVVGNRVIAVTLSVPQPEMLELHLSMFDADGGRPLGRTRIAQVRDYWRREPACFLTSADEMLVVSAAGCVIGCDGDGEPRWTRRLMWMPPAVDGFVGPLWPTCPSVVDEGRIEVTQPGVPLRYVIDARSGSLVDQQVELRDERPPFPASGSLVPQVVAAEDDGDHAALSLGHYSIAGKAYRRNLLWQRGDDNYGHAWLGPFGKVPGGGGPVVVDGDRLWAFTGVDQSKPARDIVELVIDRPASTGERLRAEPSAALDWRKTAAGATLTEAARMLPDWTPYHARFSTYVDKALLENRLFQTEDCVLTLPVSQRPVYWTRRQTLPADEPTSLEFRVAAVGDAPCRVAVSIDGEEVFRRDYQPNATAAVWHDEQIDLAPYRGRAVRITLKNENAQERATKSALTAWQRLEIVGPAETMSDER